MATERSLRMVVYIFTSHNTAADTLGYENQVNSTRVVYQPLKDD